MSLGTSWVASIAKEQTWGLTTSTLEILEALYEALRMRWHLQPCMIVWVKKAFGEATAKNQAKDLKNW